VSCLPLLISHHNVVKHPAGWAELLLCLTPCGVRDFRFARGKQSSKRVSPEAALLMLHRQNSVCDPQGFGAKISGVGVPASRITGASVLSAVAGCQGWHLPLKVFLAHDRGGRPRCLKSPFWLWRRHRRCNS
jgi:hypothetical protein